MDDEYAHASGIIVLTGAGRIFRYFYGMTYESGDLRLALVDASAGKIGTPIDQFLLRCFHWDPQTGKYTLDILKILQVLGAATVLILAAAIGLMIREERRRRMAPPSANPQPVEANATPSIAVPPWTKSRQPRGGSPG